MLGFLSRARQETAHAKAKALAEARRSQPKGFMEGFGSKVGSVVTLCVGDNSVLIMWWLFLVPACSSRLPCLCSSSAERHRDQGTTECLKQQQLKEHRRDHLRQLARPLVPLHRLAEPSVV